MSTCHILDDETLHTTKCILPSLNHMNIHIKQTNGWNFKLMHKLPITNNNVILLYDNSMIDTNKLYFDCYCKSTLCIPHIEHNLKNNLYDKHAFIVVHFLNDLAQIKSLIQNSSYSINYDYIESDLCFYKISS